MHRGILCFSGQIVVEVVAVAANYYAVANGIVGFLPAFTSVGIKLGNRHIPEFASGKVVLAIGLFEDDEEEASFL